MPETTLNCCRQCVVGAMDTNYEVYLIGKYDCLPPVQNQGCSRRHSDSGTSLRHWHAETAASKIRGMRKYVRFTMIMRWVMWLYTRGVVRRISQCHFCLSLRFCKATRVLFSLGPRAIMRLFYQHMIILPYASAHAHEQVTTVSGT